MGGSAENAQLIMRVMKDAQQALRARFLQQLVPYGLTAAQFHTLQHLHWHEGQGGLSMSELSGHLGLANSTVSGLVDRLERDGWLGRERSAEDGRRIQLQLTRKGHDLFGQMPRQTEDFWQQTIGRLSAEQQDRLVGSLRELKTVLEDPAWPSYEQIHPHLAGAEKDGLHGQLEDLLRAETQAGGVRLMLARAAEEDGNPELAAYLKQVATEDLGHALQALRLLGKSPDWAQRLAELMEEAQAAHQALEDLARSLPEDGAAAIREFLLQAAQDEKRHQRWFTKLKQQF